jgi:exonuclease SbcC
VRAEPYPVRPIALDLKNFRGWLGKHELRFGPGLTLLVGENASGKSSTLNAVEWCLFGGEVARKGSGIDERGDWEIAHRDTRGEVEVTLTLAVEGGTATLTRSRSADARSRDPDFVRLELPEEVLEAEEVADWLRWCNLPDWPTWKHAFCQHQEQLRVRVTDGGERSLQLGRLLGLEAYQEFNDTLKSLKTRDLEKVAKKELGEIEEELERALERPGAELRAIEDQLEQRGVARAEVGRVLIERETASLLDDAKRLADAIGLGAETPNQESTDLDGALRWANDWEPQVQARTGELERELGDLRGRWQELDIAMQGLEPSQRRLRDAQTALDGWTREHGDAAALDAQRVGLKKQRTALVEEERGRNVALALLRQALEEANRRGLRDACPVCESNVVGLDATMARRVEKQGADDIAKRLAPLESREVRVEEQLTELSRLLSEVRAAETEHEGLAKRLRSWVPEGGSDPTRAARDQLDAWKRNIFNLEEQLRDIDAYLRAFRPEREVLDLLTRWQVARARADAAAGDLDQIAAWDDLQQVIDEAADLACDLDTLGDLARDAQKQRSSEQVEVVNASLGRHFGRIVGDSAEKGVRVVVKATATRLTYRLVDAGGEDITPILNQAALNALSFAMLFAQAEDRARGGLPQWLVLDDPGQNFDESGVSGLAEAVVAVAEIVPVLLATFPGTLSRELEDRATHSTRVLRITGDGRAARIEEVRS